MTREWSDQTLEIDAYAGDPISPSWTAREGTTTCRMPRSSGTDGSPSSACGELDSTCCEDLVGTSSAMRRVRALIHQYAVTPWTVLVRGETGTGKELVARSLHAASARAHGSLITANCAAIPEALLENEFFGHVRGAFTGAYRDHRGVLSAAEGGTLVLDEIGELPLGLQSKLLRFLESGTYRPLGATSDVGSDVRLIASTNRDLKEMVREGSFRADLYYRLDVLQIHIPPLRERRADIPALAEFFLRRFLRGRTVDLTCDAKAQLTAAPWPGNVRELEHVMLRTAVCFPHGSIAKIPLSTNEETGTEAAGCGSLKELTTAFERETIEQTVKRHQGNRSSAARELGITYRGLLKKLQRGQANGNR